MIWKHLSPVTSEKILTTLTVLEEDDPKQNLRLRNSFTSLPQR